MPLSRLLFTVSLTALMVGCAVGPDFERPAAPDVSTYESTALPKQTVSTDGPAGLPQSFATGDDIPAEWWSVFHSEPLNELITQSLKANPDIAAAEASLRVAQENTAAGEDILFPTVDGSFQGTREKISGASAGGIYPGSIFTLYNASVSVSYGLDIFGGSRRAVEELEAREDYQYFQLEAAYLSLTANVVTAAIQEAALRGQIGATHQIIEEEQKQLDVLKQQLNLGAISKTAVLAQAATLAQTRATLPPLEKQLAQTRHLLSVLAGDFPSNEPKATFELSSLKLPDTLPVSLPSKLVEQRPDIRAAEDNLHAASAAIGVAIANRLPQVTLSANMGSESNNLANLFSPGTGVWGAGFGLAQTLFDAGTLGHEQSAAEASYDVAAAQYRKTVLAAFQNVADTLRALQSDADALKTAMEAEQVAADSLTISKTQFDAGSLSYLSLLTAEQTEQQTKLAMIQAEANRYADTAALFQSLGGGWWNKKHDTDEKKKPSVLTGFLFP